tara:strand:+ start:4807 stop:4992 length:186 start_codon:yes stop_codon:yes gene_type:complete
LKKDKHQVTMFKELSMKGFDEYELTLIDRVDEEDYVTIEMRTDSGETFTKTYSKITRKKKK